MNNDVYKHLMRDIQIVFQIIISFLKRLKTDTFFDD